MYPPVFKAKRFPTAFLAFVFFALVASVQSWLTGQEVIDIWPDSWVATDALGRTMSDSTANIQVGPRIPITGVKNVLLEPRITGASVTTLATSLNGIHPIIVDGEFSDWDQIDVVYRDTIGDIAHRDYPGYHGLHYKSDSGRNDIVKCQVAIDEDNVYFHAVTDNPLSPSTDPNWMLLLIDADRNHETGWFGYDFCLNRKVVDDRSTTLMRYDTSSAVHTWVELATVEYSRNDKALELAIPRQHLGLERDRCVFDFHWSDNPADLKTPISFCIHGDSAPNRRFNYRCIWNRTAR